MDITPQQYDAWVNGGTTIQSAFPHLSADDREFIITGYTPEDWAFMFPPEDDE